MVLMEDKVKEILGLHPATEAYSSDVDISIGSKEKFGSFIISRNPNFRLTSLPTETKFFAGTKIKSAFFGPAHVYLCVVDTEPHSSFNASDASNLQCAADLLSDLLHCKKPNGLIEDGNIHLAVADMMHNIRTPLTAIVIASEILQKDKNTILSSMTSALSDDSSEEENALVERFQGAIETLSTSINELKSSVESHLHIDLDEHPSSHAIHCNILDTIRSCHSILLESFDKSLIEWSVDDTQLSLGTHISYPDVIKSFIIDTMKTALLQCIPSSLIVSFEDASRPMEDGNLLNGYLSLRVTIPYSRHDSQIYTEANHLGGWMCLMRPIGSTQSSSSRLSQTISYENNMSIISNNYYQKSNNSKLCQIIQNIGGNICCHHTDSFIQIECRIPCEISLSSQSAVCNRTTSTDGTPHYLQVERTKSAGSSMSHQIKSSRKPSFDNT